MTRIDTNASGSASLLESYLFGGRAPGVTEGHGLAVDGTGSIYLAGFTTASDLPVIAPAQEGLHGGSDAFLAKLTPSTSQTDLSVTISASPDPVGQNDNLTLTITVTNNGPNPISDAFLSDLLDTNDVFVSASPAPASQSGRIVNFVLGALAVGASTQVQVVAKVGPPLDPNVNINNNTAIVRADRPDTSPANNTFTAGTLIKVKTADIAINPSVEGGAILEGQNFTYELKVTNNGPDTATGVKVQATLPNNAIFVSSTPAATSVNGSVQNFSLPDIPAGQTASVFITMTPLVTSGSFVELQAQAAANEFESDASNNSATLLKVVSTPDQADLAVTLDGPSSGITGIGDITYTATVVNNGPHAADHVVLTADATSLFPIISITPSQGTASQANNIVTVQLGSLAVGATATVTFVVHVDTDAQVTVHAAVKADESDPDPNNDTAKARVKVRNGSLVFVVTNTNDSGPGSLRQAILDSEDAQSTVAFPNQIVFDIPESDPGKNPTTGAFVIKPLSALPALFNPAVIDGYTQPGAAPNSNPIDQADNAHIRIELDGSQEGLPNNGFDIYATNCVIRGLAINNFLTKLQRGTTVNLLLNGFGLDVNADNTTVEGCFIGTDASGTVAHGNETTGIAIFGNYNTIGGTTAAARNLISGNGALAVAVASGVGHNVILGNFIGTDVTGAKALPTNLLTVAGLYLASTGASPRASTTRSAARRPRPAT